MTERKTDARQRDPRKTDERDPRKSDARGAQERERGKRTPGSRDKSAPRTPSKREPLRPYAGPVREHGDPGLSAILARALHAAEDADPFVLTHGFHAWPARMHPATAHVLVRALARPGARVLDPFMGSGTVPLEAMLGGARAAGVDLNPLASMVARVRCDARTAREAARLRETAMAVGELSLERVRARTPAHARLGRDLAAMHAGHVLKEMAGLLEELRRVEDARDLLALEVCFSSLVVKLSRKRGDTSGDALETAGEKRIRKGLTTELFVRKAEELAERQYALGRALSRDAEPPRFFLGDARKLETVLGTRARFDLVVTSPPYGGTYDYVAHHALRLAWLGLPSGELRRGEVGARRELSGEGALERWDKQVYGMLASMRAVLGRGALVVLVVGDGQVEKRRVPAIAQLVRVAPHAGLELVASASQERPDWRGGRPREEHVVALRGLPSR